MWNFWILVTIISCCCCCSYSLGSSLVHLSFVALFLPELLDNYSSSGIATDDSHISSWVALRLGHSCCIWQTSHWDWLLLSWGWYRQLARVGLVVDQGSGSNLLFTYDLHVLLEVSDLQCLVLSLTHLIECCCIWFSNVMAQVGFPSISDSSPF